MFFSSWQDLLRILVVGVLAYTALVLLLRVSGNRTLSKLNAFDLIVTVALGSTLASMLLSKDAALADGVLAFAILIGLQFVATFISARSERFNKLLKADPVLLVRNGELLERAMRQARVVDEELRAVLRGAGISDVRDASAVILESDGSFSIIRKDGDAGRSTLVDVTRVSGQPVRPGC